MHVKLTTLTLTFMSIYSYTVACLYGTQLRCAQRAPAHALRPSGGEATADPVASLLLGS